MDREFRYRLDDFVKERTTEKRYRHIQGVVETAVALAEKYGADVESADIAALFHDACKNLDIDEMNMLVEKYGIGDVYIDKPQLAHSKLAAAILREEFGVQDEDILNAISYHTTGRAGMSLLEKIIYVSDATEPNRTYADAKRLNQLAFWDLDTACYEVADWSVKIITEEGKYLDEDTVRARDWFADMLKGFSMENSINLAKFAAKIIDDKKGFDVVVLDIREKSSFADYLVIASGGSDRQITALADAVEEKADKEGIFVRSIEGRNGTGWVLMDYSDVIVNIFTQDKREKYDLEKIWSDCEYIEWEA